MRISVTDVSITTGVAGSGLGLVAVGYLSDLWGNLGAPIALMGIAPMIVVVLVLASRMLGLWDALGIS